MPQPSLLERDDHDHYSDDDRLLDMNDRDAFDVLQDHNRPGLAHRNMLMKACVLYMYIRYKNNFYTNDV